MPVVLLNHPDGRTRAGSCNRSPASAVEPVVSQEYHIDRRRPSGPRPYRGQYPYVPVVGSTDSPRSPPCRSFTVYLLSSLFLIDAGCSLCVMERSRHTTHESDARVVRGPAPEARRSSLCCASVKGMLKLSNSPTGAGHGPGSSSPSTRTGYGRVGHDPSARSAHS